MKNIIYSAIVMMVLISCQKKTEVLPTAPPDSTAVSDTHQPIESTSLQTCYVGNTGKDSVFVSIDDNLGTIVGKLRYKNFEKDSSFGDLVGIKSGDTLKLNYTFKSEGTTSQREIYFLQSKGEISEGIGDHTANGGAYSDYKKIKYEGGHQLKAVDCKAIDKQLKDVK